MRNKHAIVKAIISLLNRELSDNELLDYDNIVDEMNANYINPLDLALSDEQPNIVRLVQLTMDWQDDLTHRLHGY